jgi:hypothetical protein
VAPDGKGKIKNGYDDFTHRESIAWEKRRRLACGVQAAPPGNYRS